MNFQKIIDCIADAFSVFDFSYIISGGISFVLIFVDLTFIHQVSFPINGSLPKLILAIFLSYVLGLVVWVIGRFVRNRFMNKEKDFITLFESTIKVLDFGVNIPVSSDEQSKAVYVNTAYSYMWSWLQTMKQDEQIFSKIRLINRYWVMQAVFEGLIGVALLVLLIFIDYCYTKDVCIFTCEEIIGAFLFLGLLLLLVYLFALEARKYARTQVLDIITLYYLHSKQNENATRQQ